MPPRAGILAELRAALRHPETHLARATKLAERGNAIAAVRHLGAAARAGLPNAQTQLGLCYLKGVGVPQSLAEARYWLDRAANAGESAAQLELATLALRGVIGPCERGPFAAPHETAGRDEPDHQHAAILARRAAESGSAEAQALLGYILGLAPTMAEVPDEAEALFENSAMAGWPLGQLGHALAKLRTGTFDAMQEAAHLLAAAAEAGLPTAGFLLGAVAEAGVTGEPDLAEAVAHYRAAAERGHLEACRRVGMALLAGRGVPRNPVEAETWLRRAALGGDVVAAAGLGDLHAGMNQQEENYPEAARWYRRAAENGHARAAHSLARLIAAGAEGHRDPGEIALWLRAAIERGEAAAWPDLGSLILSSALRESDQSDLFAWLRDMIRADSAEAGFYAGVCATCGFGTAPDESLARRHYLWAAHLELVEAMVAAAEMLLNGRGGAPDPELARAMFSYAARRGHPGANFALGVLTTDQEEAATAYFRRAASLGHARATALIAAA